MELEWWHYLLLLCSGLAAGFIDAIAGGGGLIMMPALLFATRSDNISVAQMLIEGSPKPEQLRVEISISAQRASVIRNGATATCASSDYWKPGSGCRPRGKADGL